MNGDSATAPTRPPPGPYSPGSLTFGWDGSVKPRLTFSPQQAAASESWLDSSNVITIGLCRGGVAVVGRAGHVGLVDRAQHRVPPGSWVKAGHAGRRS